MLDPNSLWKLHRFFKPHLKQWGEDYVLFDEISGDTHSLDQLAGFILESVLHSSKSIESLSRAISTTDNCSYDEIENLISDAVLELNALRFLEEVKP